MARISPPTSFRLAITACVLVFGSPALAQDGDGSMPPGEFSLGIGYAHLSVGDDGPIDGEGALRFDPVLSIAPIEPLPQLRVGVAVGVTLVLDNSERVIISNDGQLTVIGRSDIPLWLLEPELRLSWRQYLGDDASFFIEPGIAAGAAFAYLSIEDPDTGVELYDASDDTITTSAFLRIGARVEGGLAGIEASWTRGGDLDLADNARGDFEEFYIGLFGSLLF
jgi:hypothetical protein